MTLYRFETLASTNTLGKDWLTSGQDNSTGQHGDMIWATHQTAGRGTQGRAWQAQPGRTLTFSIVHNPVAAGWLTLKANTPLDLSTMAYITLAAGIASAEALAQVMGLTTVQLKPVNDLMVGGAKLGGILVESVLSNAGGGQAQPTLGIVTGIGINLLPLCDADLPQQLDQPITDIASHVSDTPLALLERSEALIRSIAEQLEILYPAVFSGNLAVIQAQYQQRMIPGAVLPWA